MMPKHPKRPRDPAQLAKLVVDIATGAQSDVAAEANPGNDTMKQFAARSGQRGGLARRNALSAEERHAIAVRAASVRWAKRPKT